MEKHNSNSLINLCTNLFFLKMMCLLLLCFFNENHGSCYFILLFFLKHGLNWKFFYAYVSRASVSQCNTIKGGLNRSQCVTSAREKMPEMKR